MKLVPTSQEIESGRVWLFSLFSRATAEAAKAARGALRRPAEAVGPGGADSPAGFALAGAKPCARRPAARSGLPGVRAHCIGLPAPAGNSLRSLRSLCSYTPASSQMTMLAGARGPEALRPGQETRACARHIGLFVSGRSSSAPQMGAAAHPKPPLQQRWWRAHRTPPRLVWRGERHPLRVSSESARSAGFGRRARSAHQYLTPRGVFEHRERSERSELPAGAAFATTWVACPPNATTAGQARRVAPAEGE